MAICSTIATRPPRTWSGRFWRLRTTRCMPMPVYLSVVAPLAGTASFWDDLQQRPSRPQPAPARSRRRDDLPLEAGRQARGDRGFHRADVPSAVDGGGALRHPEKDAAPDHPRAHASTRCAGTSSPRRTSIASSGRARRRRSSGRTWRATTRSTRSTSSVPTTSRDADRSRYFDAIKLTDASGRAEEWLQPYIPALRVQGPSRASVAG